MRIVLVIALLTTCAAAADPSYQEYLKGGFDPKEWTVGNQGSDQDRRLIEFVRPGEKIDNWKELFSIQVFRKPDKPDPIDALVARAHAGTAKLCPSFMQNVIAQGFPDETEEASIIYEWKIKKCPPHADQHEVRKIIYGRLTIFSLAYVEKTEELAPEKREKWIRALKDARIIVKRN
jgi:hypothetical protein